MEPENKEFKVLNKNIEQISIYYGFFLIIWGIVVSFISGSSSFTSYIPSYIGLMISSFSFLSIKFLSKKKIFMHLVASLGVITLLGGLDFIRLILKGSFFENFWADISKLMMFITGSAFVYLCFMSFRFVRNIREN
tara:strand:- start:1194 stop:1601 length:408 start_codon:yes stop_codon:yes gene_type:complete